jgi:hypothetical protein
MSRRAWLLLLFLPLMGCNDSEARNALILCEQSPAAQGVYNGYDLFFIQSCMESNGFRLDEKLAADTGHRCAAMSEKEIEPACYRSSGPETNLWTQLMP